MIATTWSTRVDHAAVFKPPCSECRKPAAVWQRCKCRVYFARCIDHQPSAVASMRAAHECEGS